MRLRMLLNTGFSGPQAWLLLAIARGHVAAAGIELALTPGTGAYNAAPGLAGGDFDLAYGDINALVEVAVRQDPAPIGVFATFNASPACIAVPAGSAIRGPGDLTGRRLIGHASDVALRTFGMIADPARSRVEAAEGPMAGLAARVLAGEADGLFCYVSTLAAALGEGLAAFRCLRYADLAPDLYGSMVMAAPALVAAHPGALRALVAALDRGLAEALAEPDAAIEAVLRFAPEADAATERRRWEATLANEMAHPEGRQGFGGVDPARFARGIARHAASLGLAPPDPARLFTAAFLPPPEARARR
jgi:NitT/TauT family transport system substrate-binding protein